MATIQGQSLSISEGSIWEFITSLDVGIQHIDSDLEILKSVNDKFLKEMAGDTLNRFQNATKHIEDDIRVVKQRLSYANFEIQWNADQLIQINDFADEMATGGR